MKYNFATRSEARVYCKLHGIKPSTIKKTKRALPWEVITEEKQFIPGKSYRFVSGTDELLRILPVHANDVIASGMYCISAQGSQFYRFHCLNGATGEFLLHETNAMQCVVSDSPPPSEADNIRRKADEIISNLQDLDNRFAETFSDYQRKKNGLLAILNRL